MRSMLDMDTVQIEITNHCKNSCANCSRFCSHVRKPFFMSLDNFKIVVDSMVGYPNMVGIQGGEPLLHPQFEEFCNYLLSKIPKEQLGLWTTLPVGYEKYRKVICKTFKHIFINDHTRDDIYHHSPLVAINEVITDTDKMWNKIDHCWAQMGWSASINPRGAWFCEIAASLSMLFEEGVGWEIEPGWWYRIPKDFTSQMEQFCPRCGMTANISRRISTEQLDDVSPLNYQKLYDLKVKHMERFVVNDLKECETLEELAAYKDTDYRNRIASRYGMFVLINDQNFWSPFLKSSDYVEPFKNIKDIYQKRCL